MYFEFTLADLEEIKSELDSIEQEINEAINSTLVYVQPTNSYSAGHFSTEVIAGLEDKNNNLNNIMTTVQTFSDRVQDTIEKIEYTETVNDHEQLFIYDPEVLNTKLNQINDLLSSANTDCSMIFKMGQEYESWERRTTLKLDNPDAGLITDRLEEAKQRDDEKVFRHNRDIMQSLDSKLLESLGEGYINNLENIDAIRGKLDGLEILDEIQDIKEIIFNSTEAGVAPNASESASVMDSQEVSETVVVEEKAIDKIHKILDLAGLWPGIVGMVCDVINGALYVVQALFFDQDTWDDAIYSLLGLVPGLKVAGGSVSKMFKDAAKEGINPIKLLLNSKPINGQDISEFFISVGTTSSSLITNQDEASWNIGMGVLDWTESGLSAIIGEIPGLVDDFAASIVKL